jgi:hypothetical protein
VVGIGGKVEVKERLRVKAEKFEEAVGTVFPGEKEGAEGRGEERGAVGAMIGGGRNAGKGEADGVGNGDDKRRYSSDRERTVTQTASSSR